MFRRSRRVAIGFAVAALLAAIGVAWLVVVPRVLLEREREEEERPCHPTS